MDGYEEGVPLSSAKSDCGRIVAPHFVAAVVLDQNDRVIRAAPIVGYMHGWTRDRVRSYVARKGWQIAGVRS